MERGWESLMEHVFENEDGLRRKRRRGGEESKGGAKDLVGMRMSSW